jgi:hypothetical protein
MPEPDLSGNHLIRTGAERMIIFGEAEATTATVIAYIRWPTLAACAADKKELGCRGVRHAIGADQRQPPERDPGPECGLQRTISRG